MTRQTTDERMATLQRRHDEMAECLKYHEIRDKEMARRANRILNELGLEHVARVGAAVIVAGIKK